MVLSLPEVVPRSQFAEMPEVEPGPGGAVQIVIAGLAIRLEGPVLEHATLLFDDCYGSFLGDPQGCAIPVTDRLVLQWLEGDLPDLSAAEVLFDSGALWSAARWPDRWALVLHDPMSGHTPFLVAAISSGWQSGDLVVRPDILRHRRKVYNPLMYPLDEVLVIHLLSRGKGLLFHACGLDVHGQGVLFVGVSGAGKSTTVRLWRSRPDVTVLSDDRVIVRRWQREFWACGTPWSGDAGVASPKDVPLRHIFLLKHGQRNELRDLSRAEAAAQIMRCVFPTYWDRDGMAFSLEFLASLTESIPCHELHFVPDGSAAGFVHQMLT
ncbi:MAG: hypothetical protein GXP41_03190 [Chloroflexi bacterium]|nr:hypothetical protein [Chloroflexota bacterium]